MRIAYILPSLVNTGPIIVVNNVVKNLIDKVDLIDIYYFDDTLFSLIFLVIFIELTIKIKLILINMISSIVIL